MGIKLYAEMYLRNDRSHRPISYQCITVKTNLWKRRSQSRSTFSLQLGFKVNILSRKKLSFCLLYMFFLIRPFLQKVCLKLLTSLELNSVHPFKSISIPLKFWISNWKIKMSIINGALPLNNMNKNLPIRIYWTPR